MWRLECKTHSYDWGKVGLESKVAQLAQSHGLQVNQQPYAELWMGTHPNGPSVLYNSSTALKSILSLENLTPGVYDKYSNDLPFLFKVLSINKALSIQAHPDKILASRLSKDFPLLYKDANHKPEMAIALTPFEALLGFRPINEIKQHLIIYPELSLLIGDEITSEFNSLDDSCDSKHVKNGLKNMFRKLMNTNADIVANHLSKMMIRIQNDTNELSILAKRLNTEYPGDVGVFCLLFLNYVYLKPGQAIFLAANEPHAYLQGDCVECMAASDNVVRSGLTPKFKDVDTLVEMLTYNYGSAESQICKSTFWKGSEKTLLYNPPIDEFSVLMTTLNSGECEQMAEIKGPSILIITQGSGQIKTAKGEIFEFGLGYVYFIEAEISISIESSEFTSIYRAFCE